LIQEPGTVAQPRHFLQWLWQSIKRLSAATARTPRATTSADARLRWLADNLQIDEQILASHISGLTTSAYPDGKMKITNDQSESAVLGELGQRIVHERLKQQITQAELAGRSGVSKRTIERIESGHSAQFGSVIRILRALALLDRLDTLVPGGDLPPTELFLTGGKARKRANSKRRTGRGREALT